jgi:hypothetical protein
VRDEDDQGVMAGRGREAGGGAEGRDALPIVSTRPVNMLAVVVRAPKSRVCCWKE